MWWCWGDLTEKNAPDVNMRQQGSLNELHIIQIAQTKFNYSFNNLQTCNQICIALGES